jgi:hypothetical protein
MTTPFRFKIAPCRQVVKKVNYNFIYLFFLTDKGGSDRFIHTIYGACGLKTKTLGAGQKQDNY